MNAVSRRDFVVSLVTLAGGAGVALVIGCGGSGRKTGELKVRLAKVLQDERSAVLVGRKYLAQVPLEGQVDRLIDLILPDLRDADPIPQREAIEARLADAVRQDFERGRTVSLTGWILSATEVRLCALTALAYRDSQVAEDREPL